MTRKRVREKEDEKPSRWQRRRQNPDDPIDPADEHTTPGGPLSKHKKGDRLENQGNPANRWWGRWRS